MKIPDDPFVLELLPEFIDTWVGDIENQLDDFVQTENWDDLYRLAHTLKGSCFQFGLDEIAELGIKIMGFAKEHDGENVLAFKVPILDYFAQMKQLLETNT